MRILLFMFKYSKDDTPHCLQNLFVRNCFIHNYNTRNEYKLHLPKTRTKIYQNSITYRGAIAWNYIVDIIPNNCSIHSFKSKLKSYLFVNNVPGMT